MLSSRTRFLVIFFTTLFFGTALWQDAAGQKARKPASKQELLELLEAGAEESEIEQLVRQYGVSFELTRQAEDQLRKAGASAALLKAVREHAPRPAPAPPPTRATSPAPTKTSTGPPVLLIEAAPGGAEAYVDDEPVGTTSREGRLRLSHLAPGRHTVRLARGGYRDHEQTVQLAPGQTVQVNARLDEVKPPAGVAALGPASAPTTTTPTTTTVPASASPGYLGVVPVRDQPPGVRGAVVSGAEPGSPAEQAGLRPYNVIVRFGDHEITSFETLRDAVASHRAGEMVDITFYDGSRSVTRRIQLASRPAETASRSPTPPPQSTGSSGAKLEELLGRSRSGTNTPGAGSSMASFYVVHDHGQGMTAPYFCVGVLAVGNGRIQYRSTTGVDPMEISLSEIKEAKRNSAYLVNLGGFHIKPDKGKNYNFVAVTPAGQYLPPDNILTAIHQAMGR